MLVLIVNLSVEHEDPTPIPRHHRLVAFGREIEHREPSVSEDDARGRILPETRVVRASVSYGLRHPQGIRA